MKRTAALRSFASLIATLILLAGVHYTAYGGNHKNTLRKAENVKQIHVSMVTAQDFYVPSADLIVPGYPAPVEVAAIEIVKRNYEVFRINECLGYNPNLIRYSKGRESNPMWGTFPLRC